MYVTIGAFVIYCAGKVLHQTLYYILRADSAWNWFSYKNRTMSWWSKHLYNKKKFYTQFNNNIMGFIFALYIICYINIFCVGF